MSLRQAVTADRLQGRFNATFRFVVGGTQPIGALLGGLLGAAIGLPLTLALTEVVMLLAVLWLLASPIRHLRAYPTAEADAT